MQNMATVAYASWAARPTSGRNRFFIIFSLGLPARAILSLPAARCRLPAAGGAVRKFLPGRNAEL